MENQIRDTLNQIQGTQADIVQVRKHTDLLQHDLSNAAHRLTTIADVDNFTIRIFNKNIETSKAATKTLIELSKDDDPIIRYKCVQAFEVVGNYQDSTVSKLVPQILKTLKELANNDQELIIRLEATRIVNKLEGNE